MLKILNFLNKFIVIILILKTCNGIRKIGENNSREFARVLGEVVKNVINQDTNINDKESNYENFKYQASLELNENHVCGATVLSQRTIITAAHCVYKYDKKNLQVRVGSLKRNSYGQTIGVHSLHIHPIFIESLKNIDDGLLPDCDIAIVLLKNDLDNNLIKSAVLPTKPLQFSGDEILTVSGWGGDRGKPQDDLKYTKMKIMTKEFCQKFYDKNPETQICAQSAVKGTGHNYRDSGGPLIQYEKNDKDKMANNNNAILYGIVAGTRGVCTTDSCVYFYTNVYGFLDWIQSKLNSIN